MSNTISTITDAPAFGESTMSNTEYDDTVTSITSRFFNAKSSGFSEDLHAVLDGLEKFLATKNAKYGNSALEPLQVFSKSSSEDGILKRIDDKLSRIKNSEVLRKNDIVDLAGYLVILCINNGWTNFDEFID